MRRYLVTLVTALTAVLLFPSTQTGQGGSVSFSGRSFGLSASVPAIGVSTTLSDTGSLPSSGGALQNSLLTASVPGLVSVGVLHATTIGQGDRARSEASLADLNLTVAGNAITADFLMANAMAVCTTNGAAVSGSADIATLVINGESISVTGQPNQTIGLPAGGEVVLNEQTSARQGDLTVNALHVSIPGVADVVVSSAHADVTCPPPITPPNCNGHDFVTGGGWITVSSGAKANFGVAGGIRDGALWGHLEYIDHGTGMNVHGTGVTAYTVTGTTSRHIEGTARIDGADGFTYAVDVADNGKPGKGIDTFAISLSNGYSASGLLGGGNIQLHKPCQ